MTTRVLGAALVAGCLLVGLVGACGSTGGKAGGPDAVDVTASQDGLGTDLTGALEPGTEVVEEVRAEEPWTCRDPIRDRIVDDLPDETFDLGPYLMTPTPTSISIRWRTVGEEDGAVLLYEPGHETPLELPQSGIGTLHAVTVEGLEPDTRYGYRVRSGSRTSELHHFYTAPPEGGSFQFAAWGDSQGGEYFPDVAAAMLADSPHVLLGLGDMVHDGRIESHWKEHLFDPARALLHEVSLFAAYGNHGKNGKLYYDLMGYEHLSVSPQWESVYSWTWGNAFFLVVDTNGLFFSIGDVDTEWSAWIKEQVASPAAQKAKWRIAYAHEPGAVEESKALECDGVLNSGVRVWLLPLLDEHGFHAYLSGHVHIYERTMVGNVVHIIAGGGGAGLEECDIESDVSVLEVRHHFLRGSVGCDSLRIDAVGLDGEVFDWVELAPGPPGQIVSQGPSADR